jgi:hypothetical protein
MEFSHADVVLPCSKVLLYEGEEIERAYCVKTMETRGLRAMQNGVHPERRKRTELGMKQRDSRS